MSKNFDLYFSPDEGIWYYQKRDWEGKVSAKHYQSKIEALKDNPDDPDYQWE